MIRNLYKKLVIFLVAGNCLLTARAEEGMWLPLFLKQLNESDMQSKGMKVSAEDIYSVNTTSMKDAVVIFGGGCTGEIISGSSLLLTNHHCGFSQIQSHSTVEKDYLKNGFWAYTSKEEIPCPGLTATFIVRIEDVTSRVTETLKPDMTEEQRELAVRDVCRKIEKESTEGTHYTALVKPFFYGNQYFLFVQEIFKDVRMVGAPPSSIGKFGGDTDNWMWPRHTGDFSLFRIYANKDNKPSEYAADNVPFKPRHFFPVSVKGVQPGDFTMVYGFPGRTTQYIPSHMVRLIMEVNDPARIKIRTARLEIIDAAMLSSDKLRIQYAAKQASIANAWKKWQGELRGLKRLNTIQVKEQEEAAFTNWTMAQNRTEFKSLLTDYSESCNKLEPLTKTVDYINEAAYGVELLRYARGFSKLATLVKEKNPDKKAISEEAQRLAKGAGGFYRDYDTNTDKKLFAAMMNLYYKDVSSSHHPSLLIKLHDNYKGDFSKCADEIYSKTIFSDSVSVAKFLVGLTQKNSKKLVNDPVFMLAEAFNELYTEKIEDEYTDINNRIALLNRSYMAAQMQMQSGKQFYPDANSTLRIAYGTVSGYEPRDGVSYDYYTTLEGIMEKEDPSNPEFEIPSRLKELYARKDYGDYGINNELPVAFVASNHTTGGNSGSPVLNAKGELIGTNFDRVWEGTMSDIDFDPSQCRNISLDIRYTLFVIDKYAGCKRLVDEMQIVR